MASEEESLNGQEQPRTRTARQETVAQASGVALYAQTASDASAPATVRPSGVGAGPRLQEVHQEAREEGLNTTGVLRRKPGYWGLASEAFNASSSRKRSVRSARKWIDAFKLSINCELIEGCAMTSPRAARVLLASRWRT